MAAQSSLLLLLLVAWLCLPLRFAPNCASASETPLSCQVAEGVQAPSAPSCGRFTASNGVPDGLVTAPEVVSPITNNSNSNSINSNKVDCGTCAEATGGQRYLCPLAPESAGTLEERRKVCVLQLDCPNFGADGVGAFKGFCCIDPAKVEEECDAKDREDMVAGLVGVGVLVFCLALLALSVLSEERVGKFANQAPTRPPDDDDNEDFYGDAEAGRSGSKSKSTTGQEMVATSNSKTRSASSTPVAALKEPKQTQKREKNKAEASSQKLAASSDTTDKNLKELESGKSSPGSSSSNRDESQSEDESASESSSATTKSGSAPVSSSD